MAPAPAAAAGRAAAAAAPRAPRTMRGGARRGAAVRAAAARTEPAAETIAAWKAADAVCFDVDSTVCVDEGIDELAAYLGKGEEVAAWTTKAMDGGVTFQEALAARLEIIQPTRPSLEAFLAANPPKLSPGIADLVGALHARGTAVYLVSGGFTQMIGPVADALGVSRDRIFANTILFEDGPEGAYRDFDREAYTCRSGGKPTALKAIKEANGYGTVVMIGDGATDLEARQPGAADAFIGYGGVQKREKVMAGADWFVDSFEPLIANA